MEAQIGKSKGRIRAGEVVIVTRQLCILKVLLCIEAGKWDNTWREMSGQWRGF